jgi:LemA protein
MGIIAARSYNKLQRLGQGIKSTNATVLTVIQKRADLVNKLMNIAKGYGAHEKLVQISLSNNLKF